MRFSRSAHCCVTHPVVSNTSACRGEGSRQTPNRSTSYLGVNNATISMSHPLHAPELKWMTHGDLTRAHIAKLVVVSSSFPFVEIVEAAHYGQGLFGYMEDLNFGYKLNGKRCNLYFFSIQCFLLYLSEIKYNCPRIICYI